MHKFSLRDCQRIESGSVYICFV
ncbi:BnaC04g25180D [Brassica napus]|uniref:BnaC04g25180D protein n=1 Tax=Brassica napus TaxID=3708 RepID=A0A078I2H4_BRANA|nr:BnaC04g25180D [Brassica napus]